MQSFNVRRLGIIILAILVATCGITYYVHSQRYVTTDDAYINANVIQIAPQISGKIKRLVVTNNQQVKEGELLFDIDREPFEISEQQAKAELVMAKAVLENTQAKTARTVYLFKKNLLSTQDRDNAVTQLQNAAAGVDLGQAALAKAELDLQYTQVTAPISGWVTNMTVRAGDIVEADQPLFALVSNQEFWVDANFKETELQRIKPGQKAKIITDNYPDHPFVGVVESISSGSGTAFSLLPPQNATGNWVKITQRVPVKILILDFDPNFPLRVGTTASVTIFFRDVSSH